MEGKLYLVEVCRRFYKEVEYLIEQVENDLIARFILIKIFLLNNKY